MENNHRPRGGTHRLAFTLIELLIVVAIIAILAAIAVPNFLEAQTRSKVSRMKADMRSLVTAVESYRVDTNQYPIPTDEDGHEMTPPFGTEWFETRMPIGLTSPVAYMTSIPHDIFASDKGGEKPLLHYSTRSYVIATEGDAEEFEELIGDLHIHGGHVEYFILSHGPDRDHDFEAAGHDHAPAQAEGEEEEEAEPALYDPTNGTVSNGDVVYWGPGLGFRN